jgi:hypothetical protein
MKTLLALLISLIALTVQAETHIERFIAADEWPVFQQPDGQLLPNIIAPGEFFCTGGGSPAPDRPFECDGGNGVVLRGTEMVSCLSNADPDDDRPLAGIVWFDITAIWDSSYTGPVAGKWRIIPGECDPTNLAVLENPDTYWEGTYTGRRTYRMGHHLPTWITRLKLVGYGVGDLAGQEIKAREVVRTYYIVPTPWELLPAELQDLIGTGPEGVAWIKIKH